MKLVRYSLVWAGIILLALSYACSDSDSDPAPQSPAVERIPLTQAELDSAWTFIVALNAPFEIGGGNPPIFGHQADSAFRRVYHSKAFDATKDLEPGSVMVKRLFEAKIDSAGKKVQGDLKEVFVIHKQRKGYFPAGGDFDFYYIPVTGNGTDLKKNRNGVLTNSFKDFTGKVAFCGDCHAKAPGNDWSFSFSRTN
jgi:hypothetical protein